jgi:SAM-dependent methyltransferase
MNEADRSEAYYQDFSLRVGLSDWLQPNPRHEQLKLLVAEVLGDRRDMRILDVGCGAGVMSDWLRNYGRVVASDFSRPAIELGRMMSEGVEFRAERLDELAAEGPFDLLTAFDVLEHIPPGDRAGVFEQLGQMLAPEAVLIVSTPHPRFSRWMDENRQDLAQVVEEPVDVEELLVLGARAGVELVRYQTFDIRWHPHYQFAAFAGPAAVAEDATIDRRLRRRLAVVANPIARRLRRARAVSRLRRKAGRERAEELLASGDGHPGE